MACSACSGKPRKTVSTNRTALTNAIPETERVEVRYLGGAYFHKIISPNQALVPYGYTNYGYGQYGTILTIHRGDLIPKDGRVLFEAIPQVHPLVQPQTPESEVVADEPIDDEPIDAFAALLK